MVSFVLHKSFIPHSSLIRFLSRPRVVCYWRINAHISSSSSGAFSCASFGRGHMFGRAQWGWTALIVAAEKGRADCARLLLDAGADKEAKDKVRASAGVGGWA